MTEASERKDIGSLSPVAILREAVRALPAMKYAVGALGLVAVVAIVAAWQIEFRVAAFGAVVVLVLMVAVLVFAKLTQVGPKHFVWPALLFMWAFVALTIASGVVLFTAATFKRPRAFHELIFGDAPPSDGDGTTDRPRPEFVTEFVYPPDAIERGELAIEPGRGWPAGEMDGFLRPSRVAFGVIDQASRAFQLDMVIKNTTDKPIMLDLSERFFSMADDQGREARLVYFCCRSRGELLSPDQERTVQLMFEDREWYGKDVRAIRISIRVRGLLPVIRASWNVAPLATAE